MCLNCIKLLKIKVSNALESLNTKNGTCPGFNGIARDNINHYVFGQKNAISVINEILNYILRI